MSEIRQDRSDSAGSQHQNSCAFTQSTSASASASTSSSEMERMVAHEIQPIIKTILHHGVRNVIRLGVDGDLASQQNDPSEDESMVSTLCNKLDARFLSFFHSESFSHAGTASSVDHFIFSRELLQIVKGEIESPLEKCLSGNCGNEARSMKPRSLQLKFQNKLNLRVRTGIPIRGEGNASIKIVLTDATTGEVIKSGPEASAKVEIVVLEGDIDNDEGHKKFNQKIVREGKGNKSLLRGDVYLNLKDGIGTVGKIWFRHTSRHTKNCEFNLGARIVDNFDGTSVRNASTETFIIKDKREKYTEKVKIPSPSDPLWRLINISKRGPYYKRLVEEKITTVGQLRSLSPGRLQDITRMPDTKLEETLKHASNCYEEQCGGVVFDNFFLGIGSPDSSNIPCPIPPSLETPGSQTTGTTGLIDPHGNTQTYGSSFGVISSPNMSPSGYDNGDSHTIVTQDDTQQSHFSLEGNHSADKFETSDMFFTSTPSSSLGQCPNLSPSGYDNGDSHTIDTQDDTQQCYSSLGGNHSADKFEMSDVFVTWRPSSPPGQCANSPIGMFPDMVMVEPQLFHGNNFNIQYMDSGMKSHVNRQSAKGWERVFYVLRFRRAMILKSNGRKRQRRPWCGLQGKIR